MTGEEPCSPASVGGEEEGRSGWPALGRVGEVGALECLRPWCRLEDFPGLKGAASLGNAKPSSEWRSESSLKLCRLSAFQNVCNTEGASSANPCSRRLRCVSSSENWVQSAGVHSSSGERSVEERLKYSARPVVGSPGPPGACAQTLHKPGLSGAALLALQCVQTCFLASLPVCLPAL